MSLRRIVINGLFGMHKRYQIELKPELGTTILIGPNGSGKTKILELVHAVYAGAYENLTKIPYDQFILEFQGGGHFVVDRTFDPARLTVKSAGKYPIEIASSIEALNFYANISKFLPALGRQSLQESEVSKREMEDIYLEVIRRDDNYRAVRNRVAHGVRLGMPDFDEIVVAEGLYRNLTKLLDGSATMISARRLSHPRQEAKANEDRKEQSRSERDAVVAYSEEISRTINDKRIEYLNVADQLDRSFPSRVLEGLVQPRRLPSKDRRNVEPLSRLLELQNELVELERRQQDLVAVGLAEESNSPEPLLQVLNLDFSQSVEQKETIVAFLSQYVEDKKKKMRVFDDLERRIELLLQLLNKRFHNKKLRVNRDQGLIIELTNGNTIEPKDLSSGEQHELVLYYHLLFKVAPKSIVLIDEPELSLHIAWQKAFLGDLHSIIVLSQFEAVIATHSPDIINGNWHMVVDLGGGRGR